MGKPEKPAALTRARFAMVPLEVMDQWADDKGTVILYLRLWHYAGLEDAAWPSIARLSVECRMNKDDVRRSLKELNDAGWITREDRPGATTIWHVRGESQGRKKTTKPKPKPKPKKGTPTPPGGYPKSGTPTPTEGGVPLPPQGEDTLPPRGVTTPPPTGVTNKNPLTRTQEQEGRTPQSAAHSSPPQPAAAGPTDLATRSKATPARQAFRPKATDVPIDLQPLADDLLGFWSSKTGARNERAWNMLLTAIRQIRDDAQGGVAVARQQLEDGSQAGWTSVTYANWQRYGRKPQRRGSEDHPYLQHLHGARPTRSEVAVANVQRMYETGEHWLFQK